MRSKLFTSFVILFSFLLAQEKVSPNKLFKMSLEELMNFEITTAGKKAEKVGDIPASVVVVNRTDIENYGYSNLTEIIDHITGVYLWDFHHPMAKTPIGVRGYAGTDNMIIMVNGVNQVEGLYDRYILPKISVPVEAIDRIEVVRGPMSVLYGSGAFFGAINIITNDAEVYDKDLVSVSAGSYGLISGAARIATKLDGMNLVFTGSYEKNDGIDKKYSEFISSSDFIKNANVPLDYTSKGHLKDERIYLNVSGKIKNFTVDLTHSEVKKGFILTTIPKDYSPVREQSTIMMLKYDKTLSSKFRFNAKFTYNTFTSLAHYYPKEKDSYVSFSYNSSFYEVETNGFWNPHKKFDLTFGINFRNTFSAVNPFEGEAVWGATYRNYLTRLTEGSNIFVLGAYAQGTYTFSKKLSFVFGLRFEKIFDYDFETSGGEALPSMGRKIYKDTFSQNKNYIIPRIALIYKPLENHFVKLLYGEAIKHPAIGILADNLIYSTSDSPIDVPVVKSAKIRTFEVNYSASFGKIFSPFVSIFRNCLDDLIFASALEKNGHIYNYTGNTGKIETTGLEIGFKFRPVNSLELDASIMYQDSENKRERAEGQTVAYSPEYITYLKMTYLFSGDFRISLLGKYIDDVESEFNIFTRKRIGAKIESHYTFNLNMRKDNFLNESIYIQLKINNLFDEKIRIPSDYTNSFADRGFLTFGRAFIFKVGYAF